MDEAMIQRIAAALAGTRPATRDDLITRYLSEVTVNNRREAWVNPRVTGMLDALSETEVTHVVQTPLKDLGYIVVQAAASGEDGAIPLKRTDSGTTAWMDMRAALHAFNIQQRAGRNLRLPVEELTMEVEGRSMSLLLIRVKKPKRKKVQRRAAPPAPLPPQA